MKEVVGAMARSRIALETGMHSPWVSRLLNQLGHEVIVAHACKRAVNWREPKEGRSAGCADTGTAGPNRSQVIVSGEGSEREGTGGSDSDPGASRVGASTNGPGEHGPRIGQVLWRAAARFSRKAITLRTRSMSVWRYYDGNPFETPPSPRRSLTCLFFRRNILRQ